ncbi:MAG TPA: tetratricopeptide repeat protein [Alphaproteobacteria bacterium]|jgi:Flp pilus assembly protein TadD|nr:tetratricopeptide repeat protein [Alphaproteobacteria bacterium]
MIENQQAAIDAELRRLRGIVKSAEEVGNHEQAIDALARIAVLTPDDPSPHAALGTVLASVGRYEEALTPFRWAIKVAPDEAQPYIGLATALKYLGRFNKALAAYRRAVELAPDRVNMVESLGVALAECGHTAEAVDVFRRALALDGSAVEVRFNLAIALIVLDRLPEARVELERILELDPLHAYAAFNLGMIELYEHNTDASLQQFKTATALQQELRRRFDNNDVIMPFRLLHEHQQAEHLAKLGKLPKDREPWRAKLAELWTLHKDRPRADGIRLSPEDREALGPSFHEIVYDGGPCPRLPVVINPDLDLPAIEETYFGVKPEVVVIDDLLTPEALEALRRYCREATVFKKSFAPGYLSSLLYDGFATPLLLQLTEELRVRLPRIFGPHPLYLAWGIKYDSTLRGIPLHADFAAVNVNFWITPDEANLDPGSGGLILWDKESPPDWPFQEYNVAGQRVRNFLKESGAKAIKVPYRANRAVVFNSALFHETDAIDFRDSYEDRRINITLLYGRKLRVSTDSGF